MMNRTLKYGVHSNGKTSLWQELEYRKRLKKLIESGASIAEIETGSQAIYEELRDERSTKTKQTNFKTNAQSGE